MVGQAYAIGKESKGIDMRSAEPAKVAGEKGPVERIFRRKAPEQCRRATKQREGLGSCDSSL
jgi:hypothetical protein